MPMTSISSNCGKSAAFRCSTLVTVLASWVCELWLAIEVRVVGEDRCRACSGDALAGECGRASCGGSVPRICRRTWGLRCFDSAWDGVGTMRRPLFEVSGILNAGCGGFQVRIFFLRRNRGFCWGFTKIAFLSVVFCW